MDAMQINLCGQWDVGDNREYTGLAQVPGIQRDPAKMQEGMLWFRRQVRLPREHFSRAFAHLAGARFCPSVYVNGRLCGSAEGGMAPVCVELCGCAPGDEISLEICLKSLADMPLEDASRIPEADHWRSNVSSCLWDDVTISFWGQSAVTRVVPWASADGQSVTARVETDATDGAPCLLRMSLEGRGVPRRETEWQTLCGAQTTLRLDGLALQKWDVHQGAVYTLTVTLRQGDETFSTSVPVAAREVAVRDRALWLNGHPLLLRGTSMVWHRFCRDEEGRILAFDRQWLNAALLDRLEAMGANFLRFHLGPPPEWLLSELDRRGMCAQLEWSFFHGLPASEENLVSQWRELLTLASRHPCVCVVQLWNETDEAQLETARRALARIQSEMPLPLLDGVDVLPVHKYWWSLFENLSLSYDGPEDFPLPAVADEFGGNYLDGEGEPGGYPDAAPAFERFLGPNHTASERLELQALANARVAEYWRILGVAGYATFCALSSPEDGSHHYLGKLSENRPKPVWAACSAAFAERAACLELWDRAFVRGQTVSFPVWFFRDGPQMGVMTARVEALDEWGGFASRKDYSADPPAYGRACCEASVALPARGDRCVLRAQLQETDAISAWPVRLCDAPSEPALCGLRVGVWGDEGEIEAFARAAGMRPVKPGEACDLLLGGPQALEAAPDVLEWAEFQTRRGAGMLLTQVGPRLLGEGYLQDKRQGCTDGVTAVQEKTWRVSMPFGLTLRFDALPEPESCCHRVPGEEDVWAGLGRQALQLSNGYRGGLNAPAARMTVEGLGRGAYRAQCVARGAEPELMAFPDAVAYELCGFFAFAKEPSQHEREALRQRVRRLVEDAPSLAVSINPDEAIAMEPVGQIYRSLPERDAVLRPLVRCGRGLERAAIVETELEGVRGRVIVSQLLTAGRLHPDFAQAGRYGARYDPEMVRMMLNLLRRLARK